MVKICTDINGKKKISSEKNSSQECEKCISEILNCLIENHMTVETSLTILEECKNHIQVMSGQAILTYPV